MQHFSVITELSSSSTMRILNSKRLQRESTKLIEHANLLSLPGGASGSPSKGILGQLAVTDAALVDPLAGRQMIEFFAAGFGFSPVMFDSLICQCYYNAHIMPLLEDVVGFADDVHSQHESLTSSAAVSPSSPHARAHAQVQRADDAAAAGAGAGGAEAEASSGG